MVIVHVACITNEKNKGVCVAVPQHITAQMEFAQVCFVNVNNVDIDGICVQFPYVSKDMLNALPEPFNRPNIVVFHEVYRKPFIKVYKQVMKRGIPYIIIPHGCLTDEAQQKKHIKKMVANTLIFNRFIKSSRGVQCLSQSEYGRVSFDVNKFIGGNGVLVTSRHKGQFSVDECVFTFIGRIDIEIKGLDLLLGAIAKIRQFLSDNRCKFVIIGAVEGDESQRLKELIAGENLSQFVEVKEAVYGEMKEHAILSTDIFFLTSRTEGMPMGVLEALNYGIPCMVTQGTAMAEIVNENNMGWGCATDIDSIAETIIKVVGDRKLWEVKSKNAIHIIEDRYSWHRISKDIVELYGELVLDRKSRKVKK